jgi:hypothetical protein
MKRFLQKFLFLFLILPTTLSFSQVATNYTFSETVGTYTPIVGGTQLVTTTGGATSYDTDGNYITLPSGSQFTFNGTTITTLTMTADGALWLNPTSTTRGFGVTGPIASNNGAVGVIAAMGMDLRSTAIASQIYERRWEDVGTEVVFQWQNVARYRSSNPFVENERFSFQIRINKTTGVVQVVYGNMTIITTSTSYQPMVGLRGSTNTDYNNRRFVIFFTEEKSKINYDEVYETSSDTLRLSVDGLKTFVEYDLPMPQSVQQLETKTEPLTIEQLLLILDTNEWQHEDTDLDI